MDLNPSAAAIARFRLTVAALKACGLSTLEQAPAFDYHVAAGDSLLFGRRVGALPLERTSDAEHVAQMAYATEDPTQLDELLDPGQYDVVVGNPPYITVKDKKLSEIYRDRYPTCHRKYALTVPFMERFFQLAKSKDGDQSGGWIGQITSNSFMKREFGARLIEDFLSRQDLRLVADTSGAYIPGHGTPTVIITGRHQLRGGAPVRAVLGVRGEPGRPASAANGHVWSSISAHVNEPGYQDGWITVRDLDSHALDQHPWSLSGGGASELLAVLSKSRDRLCAHCHRIGFFGIMGNDDAMMVPNGLSERMGLESEGTSDLVVGDQVRDFQIVDAIPTWFPYDEAHVLQDLDSWPHWRKHLWPRRTELSSRPTFTGETYASSSRPFYGWHQLPKDVGTHSWTITFAFVATHNHYAVNRGGKVFKQSAPVIKLPAWATEDDHLGLLGVLNSSTACFWLRQNSHSKGGGGIGGGIASEDWEHFYEFTGTTLQDLPLPDRLPLDRARELDKMAQAIAASSPLEAAADAVPKPGVLSAARSRQQSIRGQMIAGQEELDWEAYGLYGLPGGDLTYDGDDRPEVQLGERAFEIALARDVAAGEEDTAWFVRHGSTPIIDIPVHWPAAYRDLVQRRLDLIASDPSVALLESPEHKRRWASESWDSMQQRALRGWLLDRLDKQFWFSGPTPTPRSVSQLADAVARDEDLVSVLALWEGRPDVAVMQSLTKLLTDEAVPFLAAYRLKDSGLRKFDAWQETWDRQRQEDAGKDVGTIPVPPKYTNADFRKPSWWQARGKLDVPKERFILYPNAGRATDPTLLLGWAGWDHAEQALALASIIGEREAEGRPDEDVVPLVAGLAELQPWVEQWHAEMHPVYGQSLAVFCREQLADRSRQVNRSVEQLAAWRPQAPTRGRKAKA